MAARFAGDVERFRRAVAIRLSTPPHAGPLLYEALGWTTFEWFAREAFRALGLTGAGRG